MAIVSIEDIRRPIEVEYEQYTRLFDETLQSDHPILKEVLEYIRGKRGKQLRPQLVLLSSMLCHGVTDKSLKTAVALELLHTASLIHDDVVDASPMRRGNEALQERWTNKVAVLVGDYLLSRVINIVSEVRNTTILSIVSNIGTTLSSGELLQIHANQSMWISEEQYYRVISQKTASLFAACMESGAVASGGSMRQTTALREFGWHLGMCFQLKDDVFDYSDGEDIGKPTMNDICDGKVTLPLLIALKRAPQNEKQTICRLSEDLVAHAPHLDKQEAEQEIKSFVLRYDGIRYAYQKMQEHKEKATEQLDVFRDSMSKRSLLALLDYAINRQH